MNIYAPLRKYSASPGEFFPSCKDYQSKEWMFVNITGCSISGCNIHMVALSMVRIHAEQTLILGISGNPRHIVSPYNQ